MGTDMKISELPPNENLMGKLIKIPLTGKANPHRLKQAYWFSQWGYEDGKAGIWFKKDMTEGRLYPVFLDKLKDCLDWEVL